MRSPQVQRACGRDCRDSRQCFIFEAACLLHIPLLGAHLTGCAKRPMMTFDAGLLVHSANSLPIMIATSPCAAPHAMYQRSPDSAKNGELSIFR
jgi:hypothetical protein